MKKVEETLRKLGRDVMERGDAADEVAIEVPADALLEVLVDHAVPSSTRLVGKACNAMSLKTRDPLAYRLAVNPFLLGHFADRLELDEEPHQLIALA